MLRGCIVTCLLIAGLPAAAQELSLLGRWANGPCRAVVMVDDLAAVGNGNAVELLLLGDNGAATAVGKVVLPDVVRHVSLYGDQVLASCGDAGLQIIDVAEPRSPQLLGSWDGGGGVNAAVASGRYAFLAEDECALRVVDLADPAAPVSVYDADSDADATSVAVADGYAYVGDDGGDLHVYDIVDARNPERTDWFGESAVVEDLVVRDGICYLAQGVLGLILVDVSDPYDIDDVGRIALSAGWALGVDVAGTVAYLAVAAGGMVMVDVADPAAPEQMSGLVTGGYAGDVVSAPPLVLLADSWLGLRLVVPFTLGGPTLLGTALARADTRRVAADDAVIVVLDHEQGVRLLDAETPEAPLELASLRLSRARGLCLADGLLAVAREREGFTLVDVTDPAAPDSLTTLDTPGLTRGVALARERLWVADGDGGLRVYGLADPSMPELRHHAWLGVDLQDADVAGDLLGLSDAESGLLLVDIADPDAPEPLGEVALEGEPGAVRLADGIAAVACGSAGVKLVSLADPGAPEVVGTIPIPGGAEDVDGCEDLLAVAAGSRGVRLYDIADPTAPSLEGSYVADSGRGVACRDERVYLADGYEGLWVLRNQLYVAVEPRPDPEPVLDPDGAVLLGVPVPNPANPVTTLHLTLPAPAHASVSVHDLRGRCVRRLFDGPAPAGDTPLTWDGRADAGGTVASGTYVVRLTAGEDVRMRRVVLVR